ncbi:7023_t:CDS:2, partial [Paraglomus occultum]
MSIKLFCIVKGTNTPFPVDIDSEKTVGDLKDAIKVKKAPEFDSFAADRLRLWKVEIQDDRDDLLADLALQDTLELLATKKIIKYFAEQPADESIHVIVEVPAVRTTSGKINIRDAFPEGLPYMKPEPLLYTSGANWEYQPHPSLKHILRRELKNHYTNFLSGRFDKMMIPLYLFLSGAGIGKSRNANEFHQTAITCLSEPEDTELLTKIKEAWVFHVSYENGTTLRSEESSPYLAVGTRMLLQLLREKMGLYKIIQTYEPVDPEDVMTLVAKYHNRDLKDITAILVVDGMQQLMDNKDDGFKSDSRFYQTLSSIADFAFKGIFLIPVCTSTITGPVDGTLKYSHRKRVYLPVASLEPPNYRQDQSLVPVFGNDEITKTLVED